jgi:NitT/TauT family transport system permease protein
LSVAPPQPATDVDQTPASPRSRFDLRDRPEFVLVPVSFILIVLAWEYGVRLFDVPSFVLPPPSAIWESLINQLQTPRFWNNLWVTTQEIIAGYLLGVTTAFLLGIAVVQSRIVEKTVFPYVVGFQTVPKIALAPLFVIWFGFGLTSKILIAALVSFFPMLINVIEGLRSADQDQIELMRSLDASKRQIFFRVQLPNSMPFVFAGLDIGIVFAIIGAVVAEWVGARAGLGYQLLQYIYDFNIAGLFAVLVVLAVMGLLAHSFIRLLQRRFAGWTETERTVGA